MSNSVNIIQIAGQGPPGVSSIAHTTAAFTMPAIGASVTVAIDVGSWMAVGQTLYVATAGTFTVSSVVSVNSVILTNPSPSPAGNATPSTVIASGVLITASGLPGATGPAGAGQLTPANVAAISSVDPGGALATGVPITVQSVRSTFTLDRSSALTSDGITVAAANGGGRWLRTTSSHKSWSQQQAWFLDGAAGNDENTGADTSNKIKTAEELCRRFGAVDGIVRITPIDGSTDDAPRLNAILTVLAGHAPVMMCEGPNGEIWQIKSVFQTPNNSIIYGTPKTIVKQTLPSTGFNYTFGCNGAPVVGPNLVLTAPIAVGVDTFTVTTAPAVGNWLGIGDTATNISLSHQVISVTGAGPFTVKVDRPLRYAVAQATGLVEVVSGMAQNVRIFGNGMVISGTGISYIGFSQSFDIHVEGLILNSSQGALNAAAGSLWALYDSGALRCRLKNIQIQGTRTFNTGDTGIFIAGAEAVTIEQCSVFGITTGIEIDYSTDLLSQGNIYYKCQIGAVIANISRGLRFIGDRFNGNSSDGFQLAKGRDVQLQAVECNYNGANGLSINAVSGVTDNVTYSGNFDYNTASGVHVIAGTNTRGVNVSAQFNENALTIDAGVLGAHVNNIDMSGSTGAIARLNGECWITGFTATSNNASLSTGGSSKVTLRQGYIDSTNTSGISTFGRVVVDSVHINVTTAGTTGIVQNAGVLIVSNITVDGSGGGSASGIGGAVGATIRAGINLNLDACLGGLNAYYTGGIFVSRGNTVVVNGTTVVFVSWPDLQRKDTISFLAPTTIGGTQGAVPKGVYTNSPSVGFNVTATAGDTSTYPYVIS